MSKRLVLFVLVGLLAVVLGFVVLTPGQAGMAVRNQGVWFVAVAMAGLAFYGLRELKAWWATGLKGENRRGRWSAVAVIVAGAGFMQLHEPHGFKIVSDEVLLSSTAKQIHEVREASTVLRAYEYAGNFVSLNSRVDKRPLTFPVLLALVHATTGYRFENVFWLNGLLGAALTALLYLVGRRLAGFWGGVTAVAWICTVPLVVQNVTGGGFEILNLVMILLTIWFAMRLGESPDNLDRWGCFLMAAVLLAQVRYESALFILPVGATVIYLWCRLRRIVLPWSLLATPLLLLLVPWQQNVFKLSEASWQLNDIEGATSPFGLHYFYDNVGHALNFFFSFDGGQPNAWLLGVLGAVAVGFGCLILYKRHREIFSERPAEATYLIFFVGLLLHAGFMLCYFWGRWDDPIIRRLSLPTHVLLILAVVHVWGGVPALARRWRILLGLAGVQLLVWSLPAMVRQAYNAENFAARTVNWLQGYAKADAAAGRRVLAIDPAADLMWFLHNESSVNPYSLSKRTAELAFHFERKTFDDVYLIQRMGVDLATGARFPSVDHDIGGLTLETIEERSFAPYYVIRISRVVAVDREALIAWGKGHEGFDANAPGVGVQEVKVDGEALDTWIRNLP